MNLRVDLILPNEQRSASVINAKSLVRIATIVGPIILLVFIAMSIKSALVIRSDLKMWRDRWAEDEPKKEAAAKLRKEVSINAAIENKASNWGKSRLLMHEQLRAIQKEIPETLQVRLTRLQASTAMLLVDNKSPGRTYSVSFQGIAYGENTEDNVQKLCLKLAKGESFTNFVKEAEVTRYVANPAEGANKQDRLFAIDVRYKARKFE